MLPYPNPFLDLDTTENPIPYNVLGGNMGYACKGIVLAASAFPATFGLCAFPGEVFRISISASFWSDRGFEREYGLWARGPVLYTQVLRGKGRDESWVDFAKGSFDELRGQVAIIENHPWPACPDVSPLKVRPFVPRTVRVTLDIEMTEGEDDPARWAWAEMLDKAEGDVTFVSARAV